MPHFLVWISSDKVTLKVFARRDVEGLEKTVLVGRGCHGHDCCATLENCGVQFLRLLPKRKDSKEQQRSQ